MKTNDNRNPVHRREYTTVGTSLILLLLLTLTIAPITTGTVQTTQSTARQDRGNMEPMAAVSPSESWWARTYGGIGSDIAFSVHEPYWGEYVVAGCTNSFGEGARDLWFMTLYSDGGTIYQMTYGGNQDDIAYSVLSTSDDGYIVAGSTDSSGMGGHDFWVLKTDWQGDVAWQKTYGGSGEEEAYSAQQTGDGGYIVAGYTNSFGAGGYDALLLKLNSTGGVTWQKTYGAGGYDWAQCVRQTADNGYIIAGYTNSSGAGGYDVWVLKLNSAGTVTWQKSYGGSAEDGSLSVQQTADLGYIVAGYTESFGAGGYDVWILKLDSAGSITWQKTYGGISDDVASSIQQTADGGYVVAGCTNSFGAGGYDAWVLMLDSLGGVRYQKAFGGSSEEKAYTIQQTSDGGYIVGGYTESFGAGGQDVWVFKLGVGGFITWDTSSGASTNTTNVVPASPSVVVSTTSVTPATSTVVTVNTGTARQDTLATVALQTPAVPAYNYWGRTYGTSGDEVASAVQQTADGGYVVAGHAGSDFWVLRLDSMGGIVWQKTYGGNGTEEASSVKQTADGGYIVAGYSDSFRGGQENAWVLKLDSAGGVTWQKTYGATWVDRVDSIQQTTEGGYIAAGVLGNYFWVLKLDSAGGVTWQKTYGDIGDGVAHSIQQTADGGYVVAGDIGYDLWVLKLDSTGGVTWQKSYGGSDNDGAYSVQQTADGGYIVAGWTSSFGDGNPSAWVFKLDSVGSVTWENSYARGNGGLHAYSIEQTADGGYIVAGDMFGYGAGTYDFWIFKLNSGGGVTWSANYGGSWWDQPYCIEQTADEGYIVAGYTDFAFGAGGQDFWVVKVGPGGQIIWAGGSGASTSGPTVFRTGSDATVTTTTGTVANGAATAQDTSVTPFDTNATIEIQSPPPAPTIDQPSGVTYPLSKTGVHILWDASSQIPSEYSVTRDGETVDSGSWNGYPIYQDVSGLDVGTYVYTCTVNDTMARSANSSVEVVVTYPSAPAVDHPSDTAYVVGTTGHNITWQVSSEIPANYTISVDGGAPEFHYWDEDEEEVVYDIDEWPLGTYTVTLTICDTLGRTATDTVTVTVQSQSTTSTTTGTGMEFPMLLLGGAGLAAVVIVVAVFAVRKRKT